ncbi:MAG: S1 RNA-binding domain-containing protein [Pirellulaceae bacterium]|nr:S1 RNA-binding domain-containing protein [Pirellulaceae bacterium]
MSEPESFEASSAPDNSSQPSVEPPKSSAASLPPARSGPISLDRIRQLRQSQQQSALRRPGGAASAGRTRQQVSGNDATAVDTPAKPAQSDHSGDATQTRPSPLATAPSASKSPTPAIASRVAVPSLRQPLSADLEDEFNQALSGDLNLDTMLVGDALLQVGRELGEGQRIAATVMKVHEENVFVSLGGPNEGVLSILQFTQPPEVGMQLEVIVRSFLPDEGLYDVSIPGSTVSVADWSEIKEGELVEVVVTGSNAGGLECQVSNIRGFIPISQIAPYRIENPAEFVGQRMLCIITEANQRRGNLVLSRRSVLERENAEQRAQRLAALAVGDQVKGTVRKIMDFGAFVDIGGLDGLLHISQLSWERVKHPSEVLHEGQQIQVRIEKIDPQTGKIGLAYRSLQDHPWSGVQERFPVGAVVKGTVTRIAEFGAFVKLATGIEGLVHISELAHHRVHNVSSVVHEEQEVEVKILAVEADKQRIGLSIKAVQAAPLSDESSDQAAADEAAAKPAAPVLPKHRGPLKGGIGKSSGGEQFGLKW